MKACRRLRGTAISCSRSEYPTHSHARQSFQLRLQRAAAAADTDDGFVLHPFRILAQIPDNFLEQQPRVDASLGVIGAAELIATVLLVVKKPTNLI